MAAAGSPGSTHGRRRFRGFGFAWAGSHGRAASVGGAGGCRRADFREVRSIGIYIAHLQQV